MDGRVQGVFFREACRREALAREVSGWIRNRADGRVEAVFEGSEAAVLQMVRWCRTGAPQARVDAVEASVELPQGLSGFRIAASA